MKRTGRQKDIVTPEKKQEQRELLRLFSANIRKILKNTDLLADDLQEIRLRTGAPLLVVAKDQEYFLTPDGALTGEWEKVLLPGRSTDRGVGERLSRLTDGYPRYDGLHRKFFPLRLRG